MESIWHNLYTQTNIVCYKYYYLNFDHMQVSGPDLLENHK